MAKPIPDPTLNIRAKKAHPLEWLLEPLEDHPGYMRRRFFGGEAVYVNGRLTLMIVAKEEPLNGLLVITGREFHESLRKQWPALKPNEYIGKWLYISQADLAFETVASAIIRAIRAEDPRIGIEPKTRKRKAGILTAKGAKIAKNGKSKKR